VGSNPALGMSGAVRVGTTIYVSGQVSTDELGNVIGVGDYRLQTHTCFTKVERLLESLGATLSDVVEMTSFLADRRGAEDFLAARSERFPVDPPATTSVIAALFSEKYLVEVRATAVLRSGAA
jgi:enamine deaminase RidA (YjgF/YER057c/UK114 family)